MKLGFKWLRVLKRARPSTMMILKDMKGSFFNAANFL